MKSFTDFTLSALVQSNLLRNGFTEPTAVQAQSIEPALAGRDVVATAQTGTGKTLAFVLPIINLLEKENSRSGVRALILSPTRELAIQINETFAKVAVGTNVRTAVVVGGLNERMQLQAIKKGAQVVIATPGRLCDFLSRSLINLATVKMLVLDEADRMLDMGFLPTIKRIMATTPPERQTMFFSATIETSVKHLVESHVKNPVRIEVGSITKPVDKIQLHVYEVDGDRKLGLLQMMLREEKGSFLVFTRTKHGADKLAKKLATAGLKIATIHGNRTQNQRNQALSGFQDGYYRVLVATDIAARGIHVEGIAHVVNFDLPQAPEDFIHRVGRTGRAGATGTASTFASRQERGDISRIERIISTRMVRREVPADVAREQKTSHGVSVENVIPFTPHNPHSEQRPERSEHRPARSFAPKFGEKKFGEKKYGEKKFGENRFNENKFSASKPANKFGENKFVGAKPASKFGENKFVGAKPAGKFGENKFMGAKPANKFGANKFGASKFAASKTRRPASRAV